jgi:hypothetical protein
MRNVEKLLVLSAFFALFLATGEMAQAQQPSFYWNRTSQYIMNEVWGGSYVSNQYNQWDDDYSYGEAFDTYEDELLTEQNASASVAGVSSATEHYVRSYFGENNQPVCEIGVVTNPFIEGSVGSLADWSCTDSGQRGNLYGEIELCGEPETSTSCQITMDINWVGASTYPDGCVQVNKCISMYIGFSGCWISTNVDCDNYLCIDGYSGDVSFFKASTAPCDSIAGSLELLEGECTGAVSVGDTSSFEFLADDWIQGILPFDNSTGSGEATSAFQAVMKISAAQ